MNCSAMRLASVSPVPNRLVPIVDPVADHLRDRDRLAERAAEAEDRRGGEPGARGVEHDAADHLPARRAERERAVLELARDAQEEVAADRRR